MSTFKDLMEKGLAKESFTKVRPGKTTEKLSIDKIAWLTFVKSVLKSVMKAEARWQ